MRVIKGWIPTGILAATLLFGSVSANAGIITAGFASTDDSSTSTTTTTTTDPCSADQSTGLTGIITAGFTGIITAGYTGIIVTDFNPKETVNCGIITAG